MHEIPKSKIEAKLNNSIPSKIKIEETDFP